MDGSVRFLSNSVSAGSVITFTFTIRNDGTAEAHGFALLRDAAAGVTPIPSRLLLVESGDTAAACADADGDRRAGLTGIEVTFKDIRSGEFVFAAITPDAGEIDESGRHPVTLRIDDESLRGEALVRFFDALAPPGLIR
jgi:uncharacterized repeat protein (TIGR01451 family)